MIGIYALWWNVNDQVYVGQSIDCRSRYVEHVRLLKTGKHYNYKVQSQYDVHGIPMYLVLEETLKPSELDTLEKAWVSEFNATVLGLNISEGGNSGRGDKSSGAKYSRSTVLKAFSLLYRTTLTHAEIGKRVKMDSRAVGGISQGIYHINLSEEYPGRYEQMKNNRALSNKINTRKVDPTKTYPSVLDPTGKVCTIGVSVKDFCRKHPLLNIAGVSGMYGLLRGEKTSHLGFTLQDPKATTVTVALVRPSIVGPDGSIYTNIQSIAEFCRKTAILCESNSSANSISKLFRGACAQHKGFRLLKETQLP